MELLMYPLPFTLRPRGIPYWGTAIAFLVICLPFLSILSRGPVTYLPVGIILGVIFLALFGFTVVIDSAVVSFSETDVLYKSLIRNIRIEYQKIAQVRIDVREVQTRYGTTLEQMLQFDLADGRSIHFPMKSWSSKDQETFLMIIKERIRPEAVSAEVEQICQNGGPYKFY